MRFLRFPGVLTYAASFDWMRRRDDLGGWFEGMDSASWGVGFV